MPIDPHFERLPDDQAEAVRFVFEGEVSDWREARQIPEPGGTFIYVTGIQDDALIQLRFEHGGASWQSPAMSAQSLPVELLRLGGL